MDTNLKNYYDNISNPWEKIIFDCVWNQLGNLEKMGKIMQKAVFEYNIEEAEALLKNEDISSQNFGVIKEYDNRMLEEYSKGKLIIDRCYGIRTFYGLQDNRVKSDSKWMENMPKIELEVSENQPLREISFFHHIIMRNG